MTKKISILGGGNIGKAIARGLMRTGFYKPDSIILTRRNTVLLDDLVSEGICVTSDNQFAIKNSDIIIIAVRPRQLENLLKEIKGVLRFETQILVSVVSAFSIDEIEKILGRRMTIIRAMPNIAITIQESMTCLSTNGYGTENFKQVQDIFDHLGRTLIIDENLMSAATILGACGIAYFLRIIRAASQGGIQIGFHAEEAQLIAAQTAKGASAMMIDSGNHPEKEIDKVTTPRGCTIAGLNEMEHHGLSSALIKGIVTSYKEIEKLK